MGRHGKTWGGTTRYVVSKKRVLGFYYYILTVEIQRNMRLNRTPVTEITILPPLFQCTGTPFQRPLEFKFTTHLRPRDWNKDWTARQLWNFQNCLMILSVKFSQKIYIERKLSTIILIYLLLRELILLILKRKTLWTGKRLTMVIPAKQKFPTPISPAHQSYMSNKRCGLLYDTTLKKDVSFNR